jgi:hypothetical protein
MRRTHIGVALDRMQLALKRLAVQYFDEPRIFVGRMDYYALSVYDKCGGLMRYVWGFIDGTILRKTCRPTYFQKRIYSGHKRCHGLKFQSVTIPDGLMACLFGPINGNRHDSYMLAQSQLLLKLMGPCLSPDLVHFWRLPQSCSRLCAGKMEYGNISSARAGGMGLEEYHQFSCLHQLQGLDASF